VNALAGLAVVVVDDETATLATLDGDRVIDAFIPQRRATKSHADAPPASQIFSWNAASALAIAVVFATNDTIVSLKICLCKKFHSPRLLVDQPFFAYLLASALDNEAMSNNNTSHDM